MLMRRRAIHSGLVVKVCSCFQEYFFCVLLEKVKLLCFFISLVEKRV